MKTIDKTIIRIKDLSEQPESRFALLPAGLDRVIIACDYYEVQDEVLTAYGPDGPDGGPIFCCPVASGFVIVDRALTSSETMRDAMTRVHADEADALKLHEALEAEKERAAQPGERGKVIPIRQPVDVEPGPYEPKGYL